MAVNSDSAQVALLKLEVESIFGRPVSTPSDFVLLSELVWQRTRERISDSTIKRLWKPALAYRTVSDHTLNVLSAFAGFPSFKAFCGGIADKGMVDSELRSSGAGSVLAENLSAGDTVAISWLPDRECTLRYLGEKRFEVVSSLNSTIVPGDTFLCAGFTAGRPLYVDELHHAGAVHACYVMGKQHGLTSVCLIGSSPTRNRTWI